MDAVATVLVGAVVALLSASAAAKLAYWDDTVDWFAELFPTAPPARTAAAVVVAEVALAVGVGTVPRIGAAAAALWLVVASGILVAARRQVATCGCFGKRQQLGVGVAVRNAVAILLAVAAFAASPGVPFEVIPAGAVAGVAVVVLREVADRRGVVV